MWVNLFLPRIDLSRLSPEEKDALILAAAGSGGGAGGETEAAAEDAGQLKRAATAGTEGKLAAEAKAASAQTGWSWRDAGACGGCRPCRRMSCPGLRALRHERDGREPDAAPRLRSDRPAAGPAGGHPGAALWATLSRLPASDARHAA